MVFTRVSERLEGVRGREDTVTALCGRWRRIRVYEPSI